MSNTSLWWYPGGTAAIREIDFGEGLSDLDDRQVRAGAVAEGAVGRITRLSYGEYFKVQVVLANFSDHALYRELRSLESHLKAGYAIVLAEDRAKAWAGFVGGGRPLTAGSLAVQTRRGNEWSTFTAGTAGIGADDIVCIQSSPPSSWREWCEVQSISGNNLTVDGVRYQHSDGPVLVRHRDFWPALRLDSAMDQPIVTQNLRETYTLNMTLREDIDALTTLFDQSASSLSMWQTTRMTPGQTLDELVDSGPTRRRRHSLDPMAGN